MLDLAYLGAVPSGRSGKATAGETSIETEFAEAVGQSLPGLLSTG